MNIRHRRNTFRLICAAALTAFLVACGNPGAERKTFVFTPVPYTVVPREHCGAQVCSRAHFFDQEGDKYAADLVSVSVKENSEDQLHDLIEGYGFKVLARHRQELWGSILLYVEVPAGSAPAARALFSSQEGVIYAELNGVARVPGRRS